MNSVLRDAKPTEVGWSILDPVTRQPALAGFVPASTEFIRCGRRAVAACHSVRSPCERRLPFGTFKEPICLTTQQ